MGSCGRCIGGAIKVGLVKKMECHQSALFNFSKCEYWIHQTVNPFGGLEKSYSYIKMVLIKRDWLKDIVEQFEKK